MEAVADRAVAAEPEQIHRDGTQQGKHDCADAVDVTVSVLAELGTAGPMPLIFNAPSLPDQAQQGLRAMQIQLRNRCLTELVLLRVAVVVTTCTIQALPGQLALICSGASLVLVYQVVWRQCRFS